MSRVALSLLLACVAAGAARGADTIPTENTPAPAEGGPSANADAEKGPRKCAGAPFMTDAGIACKDAEGRWIDLAGMSKRERAAVMRPEDVDPNFLDVALTPAQQAQVMAKCGRDIQCLNAETKKITNPEGLSAYELSRREQQQEAARRKLQQTGVNTGAAVAEPTGRAVGETRMREACRKIQEKVDKNHGMGSRVEIEFLTNNCN